MKLLATCGSCGFQFRARKKDKGKEVPCPECGRSILVVERTGLKGVGLALRFHFLAMPVAFLGLGTFVVGLGLVLGTWAGHWSEGAEAVGLGFLAVSSVALMAGAVMDLASPILCLNFPDTTSRIFLAASLPIRLAMFPFGIFFLVSTSRPAALVVALVLLGVAAWVFWILFLRRVGLHFGRREIADESMAMFATAAKTLIPLILLMGLGLAIAAVCGRMQSPFGKVLLVSLFVSPLMVVLKGVLLGISGNPLVDEPFMALLYPVGVPFFLKYTSLLSALGLVVRRH
jgi:DNA-directed RNA polymerase subunit RPC12/RpoP